MRKTILGLIAVTVLFSACGNKTSESMNKANEREPAPVNEELRTEGRMVPLRFLQLAEKRFSVRSYADTPVEQWKIDSILRAAQLAPTAKNLQPQKIYVLKSKEAINKINKITSRAYQAPVVFVVCYDDNVAWTNPLDDSASSGTMDATIVGTHMMLEATEQGLGSCWIKWFNPKEVADAFGIPENEHPVFLLDVGYPANGVSPSKMHYEKKEIKDFVIEL